MEFLYNSCWVKYKDVFQVEKYFKYLDSRYYRIDFRYLILDNENKRFRIDIIAHVKYPSLEHGLKIKLYNKYGFLKFSKIDTKPEINIIDEIIIRGALINNFLRDNNIPCIQYYNEDYYSNYIDNNIIKWANEKSFCY